ncbi:hypothetical protein E2C01_004549 [Portunus trituberculatus]|uniref:Uncharacterized protein n=1 Tax=Portunus trituberculatus TaxID=210409 RepID=A0A5B7CTA0_PORTR|nr:hypothetical protein [Portunus trituberculatus]
MTETLKPVFRSNTNGLQKTRQQSLIGKSASDQARRHVRLVQHGRVSLVSRGRPTPPSTTAGDSKHDESQMRPDEPNHKVHNDNSGNY